MDAEGTHEEEFYESEVLDGELMEAHVSAVAATDPGADATRQRADLTRSPAPRVQTLAAAATGFVAGAATLALLRRYGAAKLERISSQQQAQLPEPRRTGIWPPAGQGSTYIVHVRPLIRPE